MKLLFDGTVIKVMDTFKAASETKNRFEMIPVHGSSRQ